jgi:hypothetical protein
MSFYEIFSRSWFIGLLLKENYPPGALDGAIIFSFSFID